MAPYSSTYARNGMVASIDHLASGAGVALLRSGGNAADAAVAASAVLAVTAQHTSGMGGDIWALVHHTDGEPPAALNASGRAGSGANPQRLRYEQHTSMPPTGDPSSIPIPGCVDGWLALHDRFGRLTLAQVLEPAIDLAENGFPLSHHCRAMLQELRDVDNTDDYLGAPVRSGQRQIPPPGAIIRRPGVAAALRAIRDGGRSGFYEGDFGADLIELGQGEYSSADLATPVANWVEPLCVEAWGHRIWTVPPNSQGYLTLTAAWIADGLNIPVNIDDPSAVHLLAEAAKQASYDRSAVLHEHADGAALLSPERLAGRRSAISDHTASVVETSGGTTGSMNTSDMNTGSMNTSRQKSGGDTNYMAVVDSDRMGVSLIQSNASGWGALLFTKRNRISLHNRGIGFSLVPNHPAEYGPNRRPPHTLSPALVQTATGELRSVVGTMGGDTQPQVVLQLLARLLHGGASPAEAIAAGRWRWHRPGASLFEVWTDDAPLQLVLEGHAGGDHSGTNEATVEALKALKAGLVERGHAVESAAPYSTEFGHAHVIEVDNSLLVAASDPRVDTSAAIGY